MALAGSGLAHDPAGRLWFSIGQSGRIGTFGAHGILRTRVVVARKHYPDIRDLLFAPDGTLWFIDAGRRSIGRESPKGDVREIPLPRRAYAASITWCNSRVWISIVAANDSDPFDAIYSASADPLQLIERHSWPRSERWEGPASIACDHKQNLLFAHASSKMPWLDGYIDPTGDVHEGRAPLEHERVYARPDSGVWLTGYRAMPPTDNRTPRLILAKKTERSIAISTLPIEFGSFAGSLTAARDGTIWMHTDAYSITRLSVDQRSKEYPKKRVGANRSAERPLSPS